MLSPKGYLHAEAASSESEKKISPGGVGARLKRSLMFVDLHSRQSDSVRSSELGAKSITWLGETRKQHVDGA